MTDPSKLFGREQILAELLGMTRAPRARLITLCGPGGVGKTRLAREVRRLGADFFADGSAFVPLAAIQHPDQVLGTIAQSLSLGAFGDVSESDQIVRHLESRTFLLVLDNFEHLVAAAPDLALLLNRCPNLVILITSRAPLRLWGEQVVEIGPLPIDEHASGCTCCEQSPNAAVELFVARARERGVTVADAELDLVLEICRKVDGIPLAIELAATHARALPLTTILERLDRRMGFLAGGPVDQPERLRTMSESIRWSYDLLTPEQRQAFERLSIFSGGFAVEMAEELLRGRVAGAGYPWSGLYKEGYPAAYWWGFDPTTERLEQVDRSLDQRFPLAPVAGDPLELLQALVEQSLVRFEQGRDGKPRYAMLETIREFGLQQLCQSGDHAAVQHAHAALMCAFADTTLIGLWVKLLRRWDLTRIDDELGNIRSALAWSLEQGTAGAELAQRIVNGFNPYWQYRGLVNEGIDWYDRAVANGQGPDWTRGDCLISVAALRWIRGDDDKAEQDLKEAEETGRRIGMLRMEAQSVFYQSLIAWRRSRFKEMRELVDRALEAFGQWEDIIGVGVCHLTYGVLERTLGNLEAAEEDFEIARDLHGMIQYEWGSATGFYYGGEVARDRKQWRKAAELYREALRRYSGQGDHWGMGASAGGLAMLSIARDQKLIGARLFGASEALCSRAGALLPPTERRAYARAAEQTRSQLGAALFDRAFDEGRRASPEVSVQFADTVASGLMGERVDDPWGAEANEAARARRALASLTEKRREILRHVAQGLELKEIATAIDRDYNTVSTQLKAVQRAFGVESHSELIVLIYRTGIADLI